MKYNTILAYLAGIRSHPIRDAWIEILVILSVKLLYRGRIPYGMRGLKFFGEDASAAGARSHPIRDAWIEIPGISRKCTRGMSHPIRDAWIEIP